MRWSFSPSKGTIFFLKFSSNIETSCQQNKTSSDKLEIPCGTNFLRVLIFTMFTIFPSAIRKNKFPQKIIKRKHFSRKNLLQSIKYTLSKVYYTHTHKKKKSCLFNYNSPLNSETKRYTMNWFYIVYAYRVVLFENLYFHYSLIART